ncbi:MAG: hypothetical protein BRD45_05080 [Bacteroidetes bacterium QS_8_64_10]|nr:MAG: hypothetical protein BRD45_05080 [Bacteroidetes bacterium QS_8_64_10]
MESRLLSLFRKLSVIMNLKKKLTLFVLSLFLAAPVAAQDVPGISSVGVKGGLSLASLNADNTDFSYTISPRAELLYVQKGGVIENFTSGNEDVAYSLNYIEIPVLAKVNVPVVRQVFPSLYLGPYIGFAVSRSITVDGDDVQGANPEDRFNTTDYGLAIGTDVDFSFAGRNLVLSARYDWGLANVSADDASEEVGTSTFMITLGAGL